MEHNERAEAASSNLGVVALVNPDQEWRTVLHVSNQVVLYNPTSHALSIRHKPPQPPQQPSCPYCKQKLPHDFEHESAIEDRLGSADASDPAYHSRASDYFRLLAVANETSSRPPTPPLRSARRNSSTHGEGRRNTGAFPAEAMAEGYFKAFFQEEYKLGMGANGSVFLCQHVLDGNALGHFAVKKIAVGESHSYLLNILREVRLLERLHHPNIITYHHAWLESCQFSAFGPKVPTLHVLMQWAEGGSLDDLIDGRLGRATKHIFMDPLSPFVATTALAGATLASTTRPSEGVTPTTENGDRAAGGRPLFTHQGSSYDIHSRSARIKAFRAMQRASPSERERMRREMEEVRIKGAQQRPSWKAVHLLSAEEVKSLFKDVVEGLAFLHDRSILHLDLKPGNVLLTWDEGSLIPRAMLSDFGTSRDRLSSSRIRSGNTGTLEYASPESLPAPLTRTLGQVDSKADMWSLGMILHKLLFFKLPYNYAAEGDANGDRDSGIDEAEKLDKLEKEVLDYAGFKATPALATTFETRRLPTSFLVLLGGLLNVVPSARPSCERVSAAIRSGKFDPLEEHRSRAGSSLVPLRRPSDSTPAGANASQPSTDPASPGHGGAKSGPTDTVVHGSTSLVRHNSRELSPGHALPPSLPSSAGQHTTERAIASGSPILTLPPPPSDEGLNLSDVESKSSATIEPWSGLWDKVPVQRLAGQGRRRRPLVGQLRYPDWRDGAFWARTLKSCILVVKVMTISRLCSTSEPRSYIVALLTLVAISDTWFEELWISAVLLVLHIGAVWYGCSVVECCK